MVNTRSNDDILENAGGQQLRQQPDTLWYGNYVTVVAECESEATV